MKKTYFTISFIFLYMFSFGNDGIYYKKGSVIYPINETKISIEKEILSFTVNEKTCQVDVYFEFNNPENIERKLLVGFEVSSNPETMSEKEWLKDKIKNFKVMHDNNILEYNVMASHCIDCELKDTSEINFTKALEEKMRYVFLFEVIFKPGINIINHSYECSAGNRVLIDELYRYVLTTGSKWAGGSIKDLTIEIDMGNNKYLYVHDIFGNNAHWSVIGTGKVTNNRFDYIDNISCRMVRILSGKLQIHIENFSPKNDIEFGILNNNSFIADLIDSKRIDRKIINGLCNLKLFDNENYTIDELLIFRNAIFAQYNYPFKMKKFQDYFSQFDWYIPDPNLNSDDIILTDKESKFIDEIIKREKELK